MNFFFFPFFAICDNLSTNARLFMGRIAPPPRNGHPDLTDKRLDFTGKTETGAKAERKPPPLAYSRSVVRYLNLGIKEKTGFSSSLLRLPRSCTFPR